ncbi:NFX1-type zinc finger-containing protein 1-like [Saccostrea echinata]|uniref:NFX1-type zinc finger-containing protein 1-like n=1 Tax=Saccostrea echinata TaxID=191078 RepID=UPI002A830350|nr:NFX1-type zinc finger-containing protein 1-like [Saccostrea echinata]
MHTLPIYDSSEFDDTSQGGSQRRRGGRGRPNFRGRGRGGESYRGRGSSSDSSGGRGGGRGHSRGQRSNYGHRSGSQSRTRMMGYKRLEELDLEDDPDDVLLQLVTTRNGFEDLLEKELQKDWMVLIVAILVKAYKSNKEQNCMELTKILSSKNLISNHILRFLCNVEIGIFEFPDDKMGKVLWNMTQLTLILFQRMQSSVYLLSTVLDILERLVSHKYKTICIISCPDIFKQLDILNEVKDAMKQKYVKIQEESEKPRRHPPSTEQEPPDDFRELSVLPTLQDLQFDRKPFLRCNRTKGGYDNLQQYLDIQFRLLREDYLHPLREGILDYRTELEKFKNVKGKRQTDIRMYENVEILRPLCSKHGVRHVIKFDNTKLTHVRWESSRRLLFGSLLCLSSDGFQTMLFATVTERKITDLQNGIVEVQFTEETETYALSTQTYVMAETTAYFEAYKYILQGLQEVGDEMPLQSCIVHCKPNAKPPKYLLKGGTVIPYDFSPLLNTERRAQVYNCPVLRTNRWPSARDIGMDDSQHKALQMAITKEIAIIQGPPGTGKTYVGLKIVELLLHNKERWTENVKMDPILVVCYTNHALDQFLVGISKHSEKLVRIGGRCKTPDLEEFTLQSYRKEAREDRSISRTIHEKKSDCLKNMWNCREQIECVSKKLKCAKQGILRLDELRHFMDNDHVQSLSFQNIAFENELFMAKMPGNRLDEWLGFNADIAFDPNDIENQRKNMLMTEWEEELTNGSQIERLTKDEARQVKQPWQLSLQDRGSLYKYLLIEFQDFLSNEIMVLANQTGKPKVSKKQQKSPNMQIDELSKLRTRSEKVVLQSKILVEHIPKYLKRMPKMIQDQGDILDWLCLDGSPESCSRIAEVLKEECVYAKEEGELEDEERRLEDEEDENDDELRFFSEYSNETETNPSQNLSEASLAILYSSMDRSSDTEGWVHQINRNKLRRNLRKIIDSSDIMSEKDVEKVKNVWKLDSRDRERLYRYWLKCYTTNMKDSIKEAEKQYDDLCKGYREVLDAEDVEIMRGADVIGMTTTGAAKYRNILQAIKPKIIIVEEAAEVLESHIVTTINSNCQHLILIGDHKQLRPTPTVYHLAKKFNLDISLFERMVNNELNYVTLGIQHRMRPEISMLMKYEDLYPNLDDHEDVKKYEHIKGVISDVYFINHNEPELEQRETKSKSNIHEAKLVKRLCRYFLQQDYDRSQITILTAYTGQILALKKEMPKHEFEGIRITSVDNFQGEENDIIILSLVRSNNLGSTGFLKIDNRICVALSRARKGMFVIGNFDLLCSESELWKYIVKTMDANGNFGRSLVLRCGNHPRNSVRVSRDTDFDQVPNGGCSLPCNYDLNCSHKCGQICHISDPKHEHYKCLQPCLKKCLKGHSCPRKCFQDCGDCPVKVPKIIPSCGHIESVPCSVDENTWTCKSQCGEILPCLHKCKGECGICKLKPTHKKCEETCERRLTCGHFILTKCFEDVETLTCKRECGGDLECGHKCSGTCGDCQQSRLHIPCQSKCGRKLVCGHICTRPCIEGCPPCNQKCRTVCSHRNCKAKCGDACEECNKPCSRSCEHQECPNRCDEKCSILPCSKSCSKKLRCEHECLGVCGEKCPPICQTCHRISYEGSMDTIDNDTRFVTLNCSHIFSVNSMDLYMFNPAKIQSSSVPIGIRQCPACASQITKSMRYKSVIEEIRKDIEVVKKKIASDDIFSLKRGVNYIKERSVLLRKKDSEAVDLIIKQLEEKTMLPNEKVTLAHLQTVILEIIYHIFQAILQSDIEGTKEEKLIGSQLTRIRQWLFESVSTVTENKKKIQKAGKRTCFSKQELLDVRMELLRLAYQVQFLKLTNRSRTDRDDIRDKYGPIVDLLLKEKSPLLEKKYQRIRLLARAYGVGLDDRVFDELLNLEDLGSRRTWQYGTWYKCKNGHVSNTYKEEEQCSSCTLLIGKKTYVETVPPRRIVSVPIPEDQRKKSMHFSDYKENVESKIRSSKENSEFSTDDSKSASREITFKNAVKGSSRSSNDTMLEFTPNIKPKSFSGSETATPIQEFDNEDLKWSPSLISEYSSNAKHLDRHSFVGAVPKDTRQNIHKTEQETKINGSLNIQPETKYAWQKTNLKPKEENDVYNPTFSKPVLSSLSTSDGKDVYTSKELLFIQSNPPIRSAEQSAPRIRLDKGKVINETDDQVGKLSSSQISERKGKSMRSPIDIDISFDLANENEAQVAVTKTNRKEPTSSSLEEKSTADRHQIHSLPRCPKGHLMLRNETQCRWCSKNFESAV